MEVAAGASVVAIGVSGVEELHAMAKEGDSDDDLSFVKEVLPSSNRAMADFARLWKRPKLEEAASASVAEGGSIGVMLPVFRVPSAPWPPLSTQNPYFRDPIVVQKVVDAKLLEFVSSCLIHYPIQEQLVAEFVEQYQLGTRIGFVQGEKWELTAEAVGKMLKLPIEGASFSSLKEEEFPIEDSYLAPIMVAYKNQEEGAAQRISKRVLKEQWSQLGDFVQQWLCLHVDPDSVQRGALVAAVAVFQFGKVINWAKHLARKLHHSLEQVKANPLDSQRSFFGAYYLSKLLTAATSIGGKVIKPEPTESSSQLGAIAPPVLQQPDHYRRLATEARQLELLAAHPNIFQDFALLQVQHQQLKVELTQLKQGMQTIGAQLQPQLEMEQTVRMGQTQVADLQDQLTEARAQLVKYDEEQAQHKERFVAVNTQLMRLKNLRTHQQDQIARLESTNASLQQDKQLLEDQLAMQIVPVEEEPDQPIEQHTQPIAVDDLLALSHYLPASYSLEQAYLYNRQVFFMISNLGMKQSFSAQEFQRVWQLAVEYSLEDLFVEVLVRGDLDLDDWVSAYWVIGDLGVRLMRYYKQMEEVQAARYRLGKEQSTQIREPDCATWTSAVEAALAKNWRTCPIEEWKSTLQRMLVEFQSEGWLLQMIKDNQARVSRTGFTNVHPSEYFYTYRHIQIRLEQMIKAKTFSQLLPFDLSSHVVFKNKYDWKTTPEPVVGLPWDLDNWSSRLATNSSDDYFLGKWENLFSTVSDRSDVLRWEALL